MEIMDRLKKAARIVLRGEPRRTRRTPVPSITAEEVAEIRQFFPRTKFFIFGHARSGTTLLMRLVRLHPEVYCSYQAHFFSRRPLLKSLVNTPEAEEWLTRRSNRWNRGRDLSPVMLRAAADFVMERDALAAGKSIVGDKSPLSNFHGEAVRDLHSLYPDARLIYIVRDGRDVLVSERFRNFVEESKFLGVEDRRILDALRQDPQPFAAGERSIFTEAFLGRMASGWARDVSDVDSEGRRLFGSNYQTLRYEDLLDQPLEQIERVWRFLGATGIGDELAAAVQAEMSSNPDGEWQARRSEDIAAFLSKGRTGNWRRLFTARDRMLFKQHAGKMLVQWGYERDQNW